MRVFRSVRARLTAWNVGIVACVLILSGVSVRYLLEQGLMRAIDGDLERQGQFWRGFFSNVARVGPPSGRSSRRGPRPPRSGETNPFRPRLLDRQGIDFWHQGPWDAEAFTRSLEGETVSKTIVAQGVELRLLSMPGNRRGETQGVIQMVEPLAPTRNALSQLTYALEILVPVALCLAALGGAFLTGRALQPVRAITQTASRIEANNLSARLHAEGKDEFAQLAGVLNGMLARLEEAFERQKRFTGDASHELRTPLATIKATSSLARDDDWDAAACLVGMSSIEAAADRANRIVDDLLILARADGNRLSLAMSSLPIEEVLKEAVRECEAAGPPDVARPRIKLDVPEDPELHVHGEPHHLTRLFLNLLENALRHTPETGEIMLVARAEDSGVVVTVSDTGEGVAPEHLPHLGERFFRVDAARNRTRGGAGLGLAICRAIVEAHQGRLEIDSVAGEGTVVTVFLRAALGPTANAE